jgi:hypothetical protein
LINFFFYLLIKEKMPRVAKKSSETAPTSSASVEKLASEVMSLLNADASAHKQKTTKKTTKIAVPSEPVAEKKTKPVKKATASHAVVDGDAPASKPRKVFRPLTGEHKEKMAELAGKEGVSKTEVRRMKSHLMLGKSWEEAHSIVQASLAPKAE